ncbi:MBL fold metallo-hydrolase [Melioribacteraceae bacterium 4301-Me]|uniref:MBL fold metallo-hydrolase n=1 Tax=Pyranulibacter aquaticus TaxID=3163344 RepID=UPI003599D3DA
MKIKFWGTRGSIPIPGINTLEFGGNTPCVQITDENGKALILDAGTGIRELGKQIISQNSLFKINLLVSHSHWDHIQGLPFFEPLYHKEYEINIYSYAHQGIEGFEIFEAQWHPLFFPVKKDVLKATIKYNAIVEDMKYNIGGFLVSTKKMNHSKGTLGFRIHSVKDIVYMTDNELIFDTESPFSMKNIFDKNKELVEFCRGCDYLIHDSMYSLKDNISKIGWGHSNNISVLQFAEIAEVKNLILFHYDPDYSDKDLNKLINESNNYIRHLNYKINCVASKEGLEITL